jgi:hypothetical protein
MGGRRHERRLGAAAAALLLAGGGVGSLGGTNAPPSAADAPSVARRAGTVHAGLARRSSLWQSETITTSSGEQVRIELSDAYASDPAFAHSWGEFFGGLVHGEELGRVTVRIVTPDELELNCGPHALGCYTGGLLVIPGEQAGGIDPAEIARHEYGHHIAASRANPPWNAGTWGPKRWATRAGICPRAATGAINPDDYSNYELSPREAWAEVYRVVNDRRAGLASLTWSIVDDSFIPDDAVLRAAEADVTTPWTAPTTSRITARFRPGGPLRWQTTVAAPLDGTFTAELRLPRGRTDNLELLGADGRALARGLWAGPSSKRLAFVVCGRRSLTLRVTLGGPPGTFALSISRP